MKLSVDSLLGDLHAANAESSPRHAVREVVARAVSDPEAVARAFGPLTRGHSTVLFRSADLLVLHIVWPPEITVDPHEHNLWAVMGIYRGVEDNTFFGRTDDGAIERQGTVRLEARDTRIMGEDAIHAVEIPTLAPTGAIHVYGGDLITVERSEFDSATGAEQPFDWKKSEREFEEMNARWQARMASAEASAGS
ncbi:MAG: hypothetical protein OXC01_03430 [Immundisolibacterales bacterium]|nr:hypothetical protein [Immundisolibacterales bacterium]